MKNNNKITGNKGEEIACKYLENKGYLIEERNFRTRFGEIDIVCWEGQILVFVEVKTKIGHDFGEPEEMVNKGKIGQVKRMGEIYIEMKNFELTRHREEVFRCGDPGDGLQPPPWRDRNDENVESICIDSGSMPGMTRGEGEQKKGSDWYGQCRVDVVAIVLFPNGEVETIRHHECVI